MLDKNNLKRIKGILSARYGAEIPKFELGNILYHKLLGTPIYKNSSNNLWYNDANYTSQFTGILDDYVETYPQQLNPGAPLIDGNVNGMVDLAAKAVEQTLTIVDLKKAEVEADETVAEQVEKTRQQRRQERIEARQERIHEKHGDTKLNAENMSQISQAGVGAMTALGDTFAAKQSATDSDTTKTADLMYDGIAGAVEQMGPWGKVIGTAMKLGGAAGDMIQEMGGGTDQLTKMDKWMDSSFFSWNIGMINGFAGKNTLSFGVDQETMEQVGSSYGGTATSINEAAESADKKYGLFSSKARKKADAAIDKARLQQNLMGNIADQASDQRLAVQSMGEQAGLAYSMMTGGGYDLKYTYAAKKGGIIEYNSLEELKWEPRIELNWELPVFKEGGNVNLIEELEWIPELQKGNKIRTLEESIDTEKYPQEYLEFKASLPDNQKNTPENEYRTYLYWQLWGKPKNFEYTLNNPNEDGLYMYTWDESDKSYHGSSIAWGDDGIGYFIKPKHHDTILYELDYYNDGTITKEGGKLRKPNKKERASWEEFRRNYILEDDGDFYKYVPVKQILQDLEISQLKYLKEGGSLGDKDIPEIEETNLKNVIPEGALHKNKHHMEHAEGLTKKGIPVIDEDGEQQAEIEHSEIIFTLEVTKKLEEYYQIFYSEESTNKEKEQAALDAGKLLVYQILENTEDRTGLIDSCKKGGTLVSKKPIDIIVNEVFEWEPNITKKEKIQDEKSKNNFEKELMKKAIKEILIELLTD